LVLVALLVEGSFARLHARSRGIVTKGDLAGGMVDAEGNTYPPGCTPDEYGRYKIIVCGKTLTECTLDWCEKYKHDWKIKFGSCNKKGCPAPEPEPEE